MISSSLDLVDRVVSILTIAIPVMSRVIASGCLEQAK